MTESIERLLHDFEARRISRRQLVASLAALVGARSVASAQSAPTGPAAPGALHQPRVTGGH